MAKKRSMPPEILDYFKKKGEKGVEKKNDDQRRKEAVTKSRVRLEKKGREDKKDK